MQTGKKKNVGVRRTPQYLNKPIQLFPRSTVYWALLYILWGPQTDTISPSPCPKAAHKAFGSDQLIRPLEPKTGFFQELGLAGHWNWVDRTSAGFQDTEQCRTGRANIPVRAHCGPGLLSSKETQWPSETCFQHCCLWGK